jgi:hypothetical protein
LTLWLLQPPRELLHFHYTEWPCHTCPFSTALLDFRRRVRQLVEQLGFAKGQTLIHCRYDLLLIMSEVNNYYNLWVNSDGGGRSGVYCMIDASLELLEEDGMVDVFGYLKKLRLSRKGLVETQVRHIDVVLYSFFDVDVVEGSNLFL